MGELRHGELGTHVDDEVTVTDIVTRLRRWTHAVYAAPASDLMAEPDWIPVTERLPEKGGVFPYVLVQIGGMHYPAIARRSESSSGWVEIGDGRMFSAWEITHWMPLPAPPSDGK